MSQSFKMHRDCEIISSTAHFPVMAPNPLEKFFDLGDVELVKPVSTNSNPESMTEKTRDGGRSSEIENPFLRQQIAERTVEDAKKARYCSFGRVRT